MRWLVCLGLLIAPAGLHAFFCCEEFGNVELEVEWIYFRPTKDNYLFTQNTNESSTSNVTNSLSATKVPAYHSGWRAGAKYYFCGCEDALLVRWTQLRTTDKGKFVAQDFVLPSGTFSVGGANFITAADRVKFDYYALECLFDHKIYCNCLFNMNFVGGIQYAWIGVKEHIAFTASGVTPRTINQHTHFWGGRA